MVLVAAPSAAGGEPIVHTFAPGADSYVSEGSPTETRGGWTLLKADGSPMRRAYLRFSVTDLAGDVTKATLRLHARRDTPLGVDARRVLDNSWDESTITFDNAPAPSGVVESSSGPVLAGTWIELDVSDFVREEGVYSVAVTGNGSVESYFASKEAGSEVAPQLVVETREPDPVSCAGYREARVFLESQSWWRRTPGSNGTDFGHIHSGTCFPFLQAISGTVRFDVRSMIHDNPGSTLNAIRIQAFKTGRGTETLASVDLDAPCESGECTFWTRVIADTSALEYDGLTEFRVQSWSMDADGSRNLATNGFLAYVENGKTTLDTMPGDPFGTTGRGWYSTPDGTELGYENARLVTPVPMAPVSGTWSPVVETLTGSGGQPITRSIVALDPDFHAHPEDFGTIVVDEAGPIERPLVIDTTALANGAHRLVIIASAEEPVGSTLSGVLAIPFTVRN